MWWKHKKRKLRRMMIMMLWNMFRFFSTIFKMLLCSRFIFQVKVNKKKVLLWGFYSFPLRYWPLSMQMCLICVSVLEQLQLQRSCFHISLDTVLYFSYFSSVLVRNIFQNGPENLSWCSKPNYFRHFCWLCSYHTRRWWLEHSLWFNVQI